MESLMFMKFLKQFNSIKKYNQRSLIVRRLEIKENSQSVVRHASISNKDYCNYKLLIASNKKFKRFCQIFVTI